MGAVVNSSHIVSATASSGAPFPCSTTGLFPRGAVLLELLQCESFSYPAVLRKMLQHVPSHGVQSLRNRLFPCGSPGSGHTSCQQTCFSMCSSVHGSACSDKTLLQGCFAQAAGGCLLRCGPLWSMSQGMATSAWFVPPILHWPWRLQGCSSHI